MAASGRGVALHIAVCQPAGDVFRYDTVIHAEGTPAAAANFTYVERILKFLLWARGGNTIYLEAPPSLIDQLRRYYETSPAGRFDVAIVARDVFGGDLAIRPARVADFPAATITRGRVGGHLKGYRIGFDLGASDRKAAAVIDGKVVFSEEIEWDPRAHSDPQWHFDQIMDSIRCAAAHLPRVDAIGGSAAGVYVDNEVRLCSLFRGVPDQWRDARVRRIFPEIAASWKVPFRVFNDGEVTALAGAMMIGEGAVLGIAMGSSEAGGYVDAHGNLTTQIDELAFAPLDYAPDAPRDEWSGDIGCGAQYFSQQCVGRLVKSAGLDLDPALALPEQLKAVQERMSRGDAACRKIYETIGTYLGYTLPHYAEFYDFRHILVLGRVMTGEGGDLILATARKVLDAEFPELARSFKFQQPDEKFKRHGQAIAAASLPAANGD